MLEFLKLPISSILSINRDQKSNKIIEGTNRRAYEFPLSQRLLNLILNAPNLTSKENQ